MFEKTNKEQNIRIEKYINRIIIIIYFLERM